jgi:hypothetical protein
MAKKKRFKLENGRLKRWKKSENESGCKFGRQVPPHWYRNYLNRKERRKSRQAVGKNEAIAFPYIHPSTASWYW